MNTFARLLSVVPALAPDVVVSWNMWRVDQWDPLIQFARDVSEVASRAMVRRRRRRARDDTKRRAARA